MQNPLRALLWSANATSSTAFSTGDEPNAVSEREQSEIASSFAAVCVFHYLPRSVPLKEALPPENGGIVRTRAKMRENPKVVQT